MKIDRDELTMDDGTTYYANRGIVGLDYTLTLFGGYDQGISTEDFEAVPPHHRREIAEYMIALWTRVRDGEQEKGDEW